jgi:SAM-dependent methyltransferase
MIQSQQKNFTRRSRSIPRKLLRERAVHLLPLYYLLRLSDLGREGIERSGSFAFADHIYRGIPSGRTIVGRWIDGWLLRMPAARAFRRRFEYAQLAVRLSLESFPRTIEPLRVLAVPCGIPRDMINLARTLAADNPGLLARIAYHGLDIDPEVLALARPLTEHCGFASADYHRGSALAPADYPRLKFHAIVSTGLADFLDDEELSAFYTILYARLEPGGTLYTSASGRDRWSDALLRLAELIPSYRSLKDLDPVLRQLPWRRLDLIVDSTGLQTFVAATK